MRRTDVHELKLPVFSLRTSFYTLLEITVTEQSQVCDSACSLHCLLVVDEFRYLLVTLVLQGFGSRGLMLIL